MKALLQAWQENDLVAFASALGVTLGLLIAMGIARHLAARALDALARRTTTVLDDGAASAVRATHLWLLLPVAIQAGASMLELPARIDRAIGLASIIGLVIQAGLWASHVAVYWIESRARRSEGGNGDALMAIALLGFAARVAIWALVLLLVLEQLGFNVTTLVAGLGVGGVAIALAVQNILGDLFASLSIVLDRPFAVGDFIVVDSLRGTVERMGIKTTRVRSLDGEMLVFSNSDLLKSRIRNFRQLSERRICFTIGVVYETTLEKVRAIPSMLREAVQAQGKARVDRAHFKEYGESALVFEVVYFVSEPDYNLYMDIQQAINLALFERFAREGIAFAYPTRTLRIAGAPAAGMEGAAP
ncbi:MAG TPA: mechanosensitive ion channel family protein [Usitatibacter sp.]|nr:mechanosensitive ion channel family protein [Usitatibacter sp.]